MKNHEPPEPDDAKAEDNQNSYSAECLHFRMYATIVLRDLDRKGLLNSGRIGVFVRTLDLASGERRQAPVVLSHRRLRRGKARQGKAQLAPTNGADLRYCNA
jgi:hypothetical protein